LPRRPYAALPIGWAAVVLVLTLTPANEMPRTPDWELLSFDTAAHAGVFVVLAGLSWFSARRQRRWLWLARHAGLAVFVGSTLFGGLIEVLQYAMHLGRHGDWVDLLSDAIGSGVAMGAATAWASWWGRRTLRLVPVFWLGLLLAASATQAQDIARARRTIETLASPEMHGRGYVQQGEHKAAAYLRARLRELKLEPLAADYTQPFALDVNTFPGALRWNLVAGDTHRLLATGVPGRDYIVAPNSGGGNLRNLPLVKIDTTIFTSSPAGIIARQSLLKLPLQHQAVLLTARDVSHLPTLPSNLQQHLDSAAAWLKLVPKLTASVAAEQNHRIDLEIISPKKETGGIIICGVPISKEQPKLTANISVDAQLQRNYQTQNLAAVIRGTAQPDSFVVVSAHYDHLGMMGKDVYFPGANDNASGVALLLELAAHYARPENRPACSVVFLLFGAEEAGLVGSSYFVAHPLIPLKSIRFLVNLDLLGTGEQGATVVNGRVFEAPYRRLLALNEAHHYLPALGARGRAANSDHYPFSEAGVPAFFIYTRGGSTAYHDVNDQPKALSLAGFVGAFGLVRDFLNEEGAAPATKK
jgi:VanZ family protein